MSTAKAFKTNDLIVAELYDLNNKRLWYKNYYIPDFIDDLNDLYRLVILDIQEYLGRIDNNYKPLVEKYRIQLRFLIE